MRARRVGRAERRIDQARQRVATRMAILGPEWRVFDARDLGLDDRMHFLTIGPGGIFAVAIKRHGRSRVMLAGDVVMIDGKRPPHVARARRAAKRAAAAMSAQANTEIPVIPVLAFVGSGELSVQGLPKGCLVTSYRELDRILDSRGTFLSARTVDRLVELASRRDTWFPDRIPATVAV